MRQSGPSISTRCTTRFRPLIARRLAIVVTRRLNHEPRSAGDPARPNSLTAHLHDGGLRSAAVPIPYVLIVCAAIEACARSAERQLPTEQTLPRPALVGVERSRLGERRPVPLRERRQRALPLVCLGLM